MQKNKKEIFYNISKIILIILVLVVIIKTIIECINQSRFITNSFPWYSPIIFNGLFFGIPLLLIGVCLLIFRTKINNSK